jgi:cyclophilin family peptidyl-prolyl cis-trans isomerase
MTGGFSTVLRCVLSCGVLFVLVSTAASVVRAQPPSPATREIATVETTAGSFEIELDRTSAPRTVENFVRLAQRGYFSGTPVFHVLRDSMVFLGDPTGTGAGGESIYGRTFPDELGALGQQQPYRRGVVAMAHGPVRDANTSVFFICVKDAALPTAHTVFGQVLRGMDAIDRIAAAEVVAAGGSGRPRRDVTITRVSIRTQNGTRP